MGWNKGGGNDPQQSRGLGNGIPGLDKFKQGGQPANRPVVRREEAPASRPTGSDFEQEVFANYGKTLTQTGQELVEAVFVYEDANASSTANAFDRLAEGLGELVKGKRFPNSVLNGDLRTSIGRARNRVGLSQLRAELALMASKHERDGGQHLRTVLTAAIDAAKDRPDFCGRLTAFYNAVLAYAASSEERGGGRNVR
jgi:hypothetical protein